MNTRDRLLNLLKENQGDWISGEILSSRLGISRNAVSKHIKALKEQGYGLESIPRRGYLFTERSELLLENEISEGLDSELFKNKIVTFEKTCSTNLQAKLMAEDSAPEGTLVVTEDQSSGKGRKGRSWFTERGKGISASIILRPQIPPNEASRFTLLAAVAVSEAIQEIAGLNPKIKWPNDIYLGGRKVCGILTEISTEMDAIDYLIVGLGMNVNNEKFEDDLKEKATSIYLQTGSRFSRVNLLQSYLKHFEKFYQILLTEGFAPVLKRWKELCDTIGRNVEIDTISQTHQGKVVDVNNYGALILEEKSGELQIIYSGDISFPDGKMVLVK